MCLAVDDQDGNGCNWKSLAHFFKFPFSWEIEKTDSGLFSLEPITRIFCCFFVVFFVNFRAIL